MSTYVWHKLSQACCCMNPNTEDIVLTLNWTQNHNKHSKNIQKMIILQMVKFDTDKNSIRY